MTDISRLLPEIPVDQIDLSDEDIPESLKRSICQEGQIISSDAEHIRFREELFTRHTYGFDLDPDKFIGLAEDVQSTFEMVRTDLTEFFDQF